MIEFLEQLAEALNASGLPAQAGPGFVELKQFPFEACFYFEDKENPELAFAMLDVLEGRGLRPKVWATDPECRHCFLENDNHYAPKRTEAIAKAFISARRKGLLGDSQ